MLFNNSPEMKEANFFSRKKFNSYHTFEIRTFQHQPPQHLPWVSDENVPPPNGFHNSSLLFCRYIVQKFDADLSGLKLRCLRCCISPRNSDRESVSWPFAFVEVFSSISVHVPPLHLHRQQQMVKSLWHCTTLTWLLLSHLPSGLSSAASPTLKTPLTTLGPPK